MKKAVSPLISFVLTILLVSAATTIVLTVIKPTFDRMSDSSIINEATQNLELMNSAIKQVASESQGSKRTISLTVSDGEYGINAAKDFIYYNYSTKTDFSLQGISGNVRLDKSPVFIDYFNNYVENSNASPPWTIKNGTWTIESGEYSGQNGLAYYNFGTTNYFSLEGRITNKSGTNGEIFALPVPPDDLRLYLTFDENSGNYTYDYSGFNNTGTLYNGTTICSGGTCPAWTTGKFDYALQFDGSNDYVNVTSLSSMGTTVELWKKNTTDSAWYHLANSSGTLYINGVTGSGQVIPITNSSGTVVVGKDASGNYFNGSIDEVKIYNRSLSADEVKADYELGIKKLSSTGRTDLISTSTNVYLVLANPNGHTHFDEVKIKTNKRNMMLSIPYLNVDLNGTARFSKGNNQLTIENKGFNTTLNRPIIEIMVA
jgi:hypothetical protein